VKFNKNLQQAPPQNPIETAWLFREIANARAILYAAKQLLGDLDGGLDSGYDPFERCGFRSDDTFVERQAFRNADCSRLRAEPASPRFERRTSGVS
jgi:hypothetical protein